MRKEQTTSASRSKKRQSLTFIKRIHQTPARKIEPLCQLGAHPPHRNIAFRFSYLAKLLRARLCSAGHVLVYWESAAGEESVHYCRTVDIYGRQRIFICSFCCSCNALVVRTESRILGAVAP